MGSPVCTSIDDRDDEFIIKSRRVVSGRFVVGDDGHLRPSSTALISALRSALVM